MPFDFFHRMLKIQSSDITMFCRLDSRSFKLCTPLRCASSLGHFAIFAVLAFIWMSAALMGKSCSLSCVHGLTMLRIKFSSIEGMV